VHVFESRIREEVRERRGAAYVSDVGFMQSDAYPGYAFITAMIDLHPKDVKKQSETVRKLASALVKRGITKEEWLRAKAQVVAAAKRSLSDNGYWLGAVLADSQQRPDRLETARTLVSDAETAALTEVNALAARYLDPKKAFYSLIEPNARGPKSPK
ncbi:MAG TPA: insulinase family protein, partial [Candidatus Synoicihabitans sp.]|nr:insulinase family protein [Candidatus Synoicihabitans sp.]